MCRLMAPSIIPSVPLLARYKEKALLTTCFAVLAFLVVALFRGTPESQEGSGPEGVSGEALQFVGFEGGDSDPVVVEVTEDDDEVSVLSIVTAGPDTVLPGWVPGWMVGPQTDWPPEEDPAPVWPLAGEGDPELDHPGKHEEIHFKVEPELHPSMKKLCAGLDILHELRRKKAEQFWSAATSNAFGLVKLDTAEMPRVSGVADARLSIQERAGKGLTIGLDMSRTPLEIAIVADHELTHVLDCYRCGANNLPTDDCTEKVAWESTLHLLIEALDRYEDKGQYKIRKAVVKTALKKATAHALGCPEGESLVPQIDLVYRRFRYKLGEKFQIEGLDSLRERDSNRSVGGD